MVNGIFAAQIEYGGGGVEREKERYRESNIQTDREREWAESKRGTVRSADLYV